MQHNTQRPESRAVGTGKELEVHSIFYTIQGEGPFSGRPATFIRLAGCNLQCPGCDTNYTSERRLMPVSTIAEKARHLWTAPTAPLYVITGGEPFRQNIAELVRDLMHEPCIVQVETNGTLAPPTDLHPDTVVVCSPKGSKVAPALYPWIRAYKYVLDASHVHPKDGLPTNVLGNERTMPARPHAGYKGPIYVSPMDEQDAGYNADNVQAAAATCMKHGFTLNIQIHKIANLP